MRRVVDTYRDRTIWRAMQRSGMAAKVDWSASADAFASLYRRIMDRSSHA